MENFKLLLKNKLSIISTITKSWAIFIVLSASFMRQLLNLLKEVMTLQSISIVVWIVGAIPVSGFLVYLIFTNRRAALLRTIGVIIIAFLFAFHMELFEERVHIIKYGLLGILLARDFNQVSTKERFAYVSIVGILVASCDELFQALLPYRVGDLRDVIIDFFSVMLGLGIFQSTINDERINLGGTKFR